MLHALENIVWPLVGLGALGAFIDFLLGAPNREKVKDWLLERWVRFDDLKWSNFSQAEAMYFVALSDRLFGARFFSWRRVLSAIFLYIACLAFWVVREPYSYPSLKILLNWQSALEEFGLPTLFFMLSISLTRWISVQVIMKTGGRHLGVFPYVVLLGLHLLLFQYWRPVVEAIRVQIADAIYLGPRAIHLSVASWLEEISQRNLPIRTVFAGFPFASVLPVKITPLVMAYVANALRIVIALAMLLTFIFRKWITVFISLVWRRTVEDSAPVFTLIGGALGALFGGVIEVAKHLTGAGT